MWEDQTDAICDSDKIYCIIYIFLIFPCQIFNLQPELYLLSVNDNEIYF